MLTSMIRLMPGMKLLNQSFQLNMSRHVKGNTFPHYLPFVRGAHRSLVDSWSPMDSPHKGQGMLNFEVLLDISLNKPSYKRSGCRWFGKPPSLWDKIVIKLCLYNFFIDAKHIFLSIDVRDQLSGLAYQRVSFKTELNPGAMNQAIGIIVHHIIYCALCGYRAISKMIQRRQV